MDEFARGKVLWRARKAALPLHPEALLQEVLQNSQDQDLGNLTAQDLNRTLASWLDPRGLRFLLLGGDAATLKLAEKAGLGPATLVN